MSDTDSTAITDVAVFDGRRRLGGSYTVTVAGGLIASVDCTEPNGTPARTLLPGLIDAHVHLKRTEELVALARHGVTTALDLGSWPPGLVAELRDFEGGCDVRSAGTPAIGPGGRHTKIPGMPADAIVHDPAEAEALVAARFAEGCDVIKVVLEAPGEGGPDQSSVDALVLAAHRVGRLVVAHTTTVGAIGMAQQAGVDVLTHAPLDQVLGPDAVAEVRRSARVVVPTLVQMLTQAENHVRPGLSYDTARDTATALHRAGVPILAGTDANDLPVLGLPHGPSLHTELRLLVEAGLSPIDVLTGATARTAELLGLADRGVIEVGRRADLILVDGDPTKEISATAALLGIWIAGRGVTPVP